VSCEVHDYAALGTPRGKPHLLMELKLTVQVPGEPGAEHTIGQSPVVVGRDASCDIHVNSPYVSRRHFQIEPEESGFRLVDLGGRNPVRINGQAVAVTAPVAPGDKITVADVSITVSGDPSSAGTAVFQTAFSEPQPAGPASGGMQRVWQGQDLGPGGTLTIMFTDLERSTSMVTQLGEREALHVINTHNTVLREQFRLFRGREAKRTGDGFLVLFASARDALHCAAGIQVQLANEESDFGPILVRIGIHVGEVLWDEGDIFGSAVNFAARVVAAAAGGEILISGLMRELLAASGEFEFGKPRMAVLKGFKGTHPLTPVLWRENRAHGAGAGGD
jgi:class 3 adenylate cyclase